MEDIVTTLLILRDMYCLARCSFLFGVHVQRSAQMLGVLQADNFVDSFTIHFTSVLDDSQMQLLKFYRVIDELYNVSLK